jgi:hypothetical protein
MDIIGNSTPQTLVSPNGTIVSVLSDSTGCVSFNVPPAGVYTLMQTTQKGYVNVSPHSIRVDITSDTP